MKKKKLAVLVAGFCFSILATQYTNADPVLTFKVGPLMNPVSITNTQGQANGKGGYQFSGNANMMNMWSLTYDVTAVEDPVINAQIGFVNNSSMTQQFVISSSIPITPALLPSSLIGGSFGGSVTDVSGDGNAVVSTVMGSPMYHGEIDGAGVLPLYSHPTSFTVSSAYDTVNIPSVNSGLPIPSTPGPAALNTIGITHIFTLTPGDSVSFTSVFVAEVIPEPGTVSLIAASAAGIAFIRRRFLP